MKSVHTVSAEGVVNAPAALTYGIIADYRDGHPLIIPKPPFISLEVIEGGVGAGTVFECRMKVLGMTRTFRAAVTEPEPGRVLVETLDGGIVTSFTVEPAGGGCRVVISSGVPTGRWLIGRAQRFLITRMLRPVYVREIAQLAQVAEARAKR